MVWDTEKEELLMKLKKEGKSYKEISSLMDTTVSSVKHKFVRLNQKSNNDRHHHPVEKIDQIDRVLKNNDFKILETNCGWGNLTRHYANYGEVLSQDIDKEKVDYVNSLLDSQITAIKCDSFRELHFQIYNKLKFDVVDLDPYGFPSRYFPHVFELIEDGFLFVTFPKMGVQQINKIMIEHYRVFWGIELSDKDRQIDLINRKMKDYAFCSFRRIEILDVIEIGSVYRLAYKVKKESALDLVGLKVKGKNY